MASRPTTSDTEPLDNLQLGNLAPDSYTAQRLYHATPEHLYLTSRRCFVGPIPKNWLDSHRTDWVTRNIKRNYSSRSATFTASDNVSKQRRLSGLREGANSRQTSSFPQPQSLENSPQHSPTASGPASPIAEASSSRSVAAVSPPQSKGTDASPTSHSSSPSSKLRPRSALDPRDSLGTRGPSIGTNPLESVDSTSQLIPNGRDKSAKPNADDAQFSGNKLLAKVNRRLSKSQATPPEDNSTREEASGPVDSPTKRRSHVQFDMSDSHNKSALFLRAKVGSSELGERVKKAIKRQYTDGTILKMEKMLVRVDHSAQKKIPDDYDENTSQGVVSETRQKWREYMIVCRQCRNGDDFDYILQAYKSRVIPASSDPKAKKPEFEIPLHSKQVRMNMYSSLDKTLAIWDSGIRGTLIYILQARTASSSVEWLTFLRGLLGFDRPAELQVSVPEMAMNLRLQDPFDTSENANEEDPVVDEEALMESVISKEEAIAPTMIKRCLQMLQSCPDLDDTVGLWKHGHRVGLAWKRYDRLEWIHGTQEKKMFGTFAMVNTHDLELRPKHHYPMTTHTKKGKVLEEPPPVEGFLVQLTSQKGKHKQMGRLFFKRMYFSTYDHFLAFTQPRSAVPPTPSDHPEWDKKTSSKQISKDMPLIYAVNPFPVEDDKLLWLKQNPQSVERHNDQALNEASRNINMLKNCEGFIDLVDVVKVRKVHREMGEVQVQLEGEESDSEAESEAGDTDQGQADHIDDSKTIELLLKNGLVIRLRAYDIETKKEWKRRLRALVKYWRWRHLEDVSLFHQVRKRNLQELQVDEEGEAWVGMFARKWELSQTYASPDLYNICGISCCRSIHISGPLYSKPRFHGNFNLMHCILIPGTLLLFESALRNTSGKVIPHVSHDKRTSIDLSSDCYLYSGLLTEGDLLYHNRTFDANSPGHHALPRMWPADNWDNWDEDVMTCFVLWRPSGKSWFRDPGEGQRSRLKRVSTLGKTGNRMVFRARSRAERDHWVLAIAAEIERGVGKNQVRVVQGKSGGS